MKSGSLFTSAAVGAGLLVSLALGGCASPAPKAERYIPPPMGSGWTYAVRSTGSFGNGEAQVTVRVVEATWEGRTVLSFQTPAQHQLHDANVKLLAVTAPDGTLQVRYDPPIGWDWPIEVGKITKRDHVATVAASGQKLPFSSTWTVEAREDVTVPAGTFKAWRLRYADTTGETQTVWSAPDALGIFAKRTFERSAAHRLGAGTRVMELVTKPAIK